MNQENFAFNYKIWANSEIGTLGLSKSVRGRTRDGHWAPLVPLLLKMRGTCPPPPPPPRAAAPFYTPESPYNKAYGSPSVRDGQGVSFTPPLYKLPPPRSLSPSSFRDVCAVPAKIIVFTPSNFIPYPFFPLLLHPHLSHTPYILPFYPAGPAAPIISVTGREFIKRAKNTFHYPSIFYFTRNEKSYTSRKDDDTNMAIIVLTETESTDKQSATELGKWHRGMSRWTLDTLGQRDEESYREKYRFETRCWQGKTCLQVSIFLFDFLSSSCIFCFTNLSELRIFWYKDHWLLCTLNWSWSLKDIL